MFKKRHQIFLLFFSMSLCCIGMFIFYPYFVAEITGYSGISDQDVSVIMLSALFVGNILAFLFTNFRVSGSLSKDFIYTVSFLTLSMAMLFFSPFVKSASVLLVVGGLTVYRAGIGSYFAVSRMIGLDCWHENRPREELFAWFKTVNSTSSALGAYLGSVIIDSWGFGTAMVISSVFFLAAISVIYLNSTGRAVHDNEAKPVVKKPLFTLTAPTFWFSFAGACHFVFEAQIYTLIVLSVKQNFLEYTGVVRNIFILNSLLLIVFSVPILNFMSKIRSKLVPYIFGTCCSAAAVIMMPLAGSDVALVMGLILVFTVGEIIAPQILISEVTDCDEGQLRSGISVFNIATKAIGMSVGSYMGIYIYNQHNVNISTMVWLVILLISVGGFCYGVRIRSSKISEHVA